METLYYLCALGRNRIPVAVLLDATGQACNPLDKQLYPVPKRSFWFGADAALAPHKICYFCALGRNRTSDLLDRNQTLYPLSYESKFLCGVHWLQGP